MFSYRARGLAALVAMVQGVLALGVCIGMHGFVGVDGARFAAVVRAGGPWLLGILSAGAFRCFRVEGGREPTLLECAGRTLPVLPVVGAIWGDRFFHSAAPLEHATLFCAALILGLLVGSHWALPRWLGAVFFPLRHHHRTVLVGSAAKVKQLRGVLENCGPLGFQPIAWLSEEGEVPFDTGVPFFGDAALLERVVGEERVSHVVLADAPSESRLKERLGQCEKWGVRLVVAQNLEVRNPGRFRWETQGFWCFGAAYLEPLQNPFNRSLKRALDLLVCVPAILFALLPVALCTWAAQRRQSPGPLFYRQWRHGRANAAFQVWKFRTMHCAHQTPQKQATEGDSRIYPFGAWLRRHSLDELPQFLNVFTGEMSVVGPRPHFVEHTGQFAQQERYHIRSFVKPGVTGLAQVNGCRGEVRHPSDMERRVQWDIRYLESWSLSLDCWLILRTFSVVLNPPNTAY
jgi:lipopolysaccharide/colanic/teichoic acid biosynthesis glycosyltransferase